jgi:hypothetical protein
VTAENVAQRSRAAGWTSMKTLSIILVAAAACTTNGVATDPLGNSGSDGSDGSPADSSDQNTGSDIDVGSDTDPVHDYNMNCLEGQGPQVEYTTVAEMKPLAVGAWIHCSGPAILDEKVGIEFRADGTYALIGVGLDALYELAGFGNEGTWDASQEGSAAVQWNIHPAPNSGTGGYPVFESSPRRFALQLEEATELSIYAIVF